MRVRALSHLKKESPCCDTKSGTASFKKIEAIVLKTDRPKYPQKIEPHSPTAVNIFGTSDNFCQSEQDLGTTAAPLRFSIGGQGQ